MYEAFYGLSERPFSIVSNPDCLYLSPKHRNALTYLEYGIMDNVGFILLTGEVGTGKTTLIRYIINEMCADMETAVIFNTNVSADELLQMILNSYELSSDATEKPDRLNTLYTYLIENYTKKKRVLLIIDEAQNLSHEAMEEVRMLSNLQGDDQILLQIMLAGQPELRSKLRDPCFAAVTQRIAISYHLSALSREEVEGYILFRLQKAGGTRRLFDKKAVDLIYHSSGGIPRSINLICDAALVYGYGYELKRIGTPVIEQVVKDRGGLEVELTTNYEDKPAGTSDATIPDEAVLNRLQKLESAVQQLHVQVDGRMMELENQSRGFKDDLVGQLNDLLRKERKRNTELLERYIRLSERYKALEEIASHFRPAPPTSSRMTPKNAGNTLPAGLDLNEWFAPKSKRPK